MTKTFSTNENNDLFIGADGNLVIDTGIQAVSDICANAAKAQLGEIVLATNQGMPNFRNMFIGTPNIAPWEAALRSIILGVPDVVDILSLTIQKQSNTLSYNAIILTTYGQTELTGILDGF